MKVIDITCKEAVKIISKWYGDNVPCKCGGIHRGIASNLVGNCRRLAVDEEHFFSGYTGNTFTTTDSDGCLVIFVYRGYCPMHKKDRVKVITKLRIVDYQEISDKIQKLMGWDNDKVTIFGEAVKFCDNAYSLLS